MGEKKSKSLQDLKAAEISGLKLGAYAVQNQIDGHRLYEAKRLGSHWNRCYGCLPAYGQGNWSAEMNSRLSEEGKTSPRVRVGSSDGYGIKVPRV